MTETFANSMGELAHLFFVVSLGVIGFAFAMFLIIGPQVILSELYTNTLNVPSRAWLATSTCPPPHINCVLHFEFETTSLVIAHESTIPKLNVAARRFEISAHFQCRCTTLGKWYLEPGKSSRLSSKKLRLVGKAKLQTCVPYSLLHTYRTRSDSQCHLSMSLFVCFRSGS